MEFCSCIRKLHYCLWRVSIKPRLPFSYLWRVLCFQRQSFWHLFIVPEKSVTKIFKNGKIWKPMKGHNSNSNGPLATILPLHLSYLRDQVWYKVHRSRTTNIKVIEQNLPRDTTESYGPLVPIPINTIHPAIVHVYTNFQLSSFHGSWKICYENFQDCKIWKPMKGQNSKSYGPLATILPLHLPYLRHQVWYKVHWCRTTNIKVIKQNVF